MTTLRAKAANLLRGAERRYVNATLQQAVRMAEAKAALKKWREAKERAAQIHQEVVQEREHSRRVKGD